jgi:primosomal protein N' (replication factor Y)
VPPACPACGGPGLAPAGAGTQRLADAVSGLWPGARVVRLDRDASRGAAGAGLLGTFHRGEADILVGTQMVAKGHHFPLLTVVGVVDADLSLCFPDFRASERTYQVLTQVAGRAGREERPGVVYLQTRSPEHPVLGAVARGDFDAFAAAELETRREAGFPPFRRLALLRVSATLQPEAAEAARSLAGEARRLGAGRGLDVLGPAPAPIEKVRGRYRYQVLLRAPGPEPGPVQAVLRALLPLLPSGGAGDLRVHPDVDPVSLL